MAIPLVKNIQRILIAKDTSSTTAGDLATYLGIGAAGTTYGSTSDWLSISVGRPTDGAWPSFYTTSEGAIYGNRTATVLAAGINATALTIRVTATALATYPVPGWIYIGTEAIYYDSIDPSTTSASGDDEFILSTVLYRGYLSTTPAIHSTSAAVRDIVPYFAKTINRDPDRGVFNVSYNATQYERAAYAAPNIVNSVTDSERVWSQGFVWWYQMLDSTG